MLPVREWNPIPATRPKPPKKKKPTARAIRGIQQKREYKALKDQFLLDHPYCQHFMAENGIDEQVAISNMGIVLVKWGGEWQYVHVPKSTEIHHKRGRNRYLLDISTWMACRPGHSTYIHGDPKTAYEKGYMIPR